MLFAFLFAVAASAPVMAQQAAYKKSRVMKPVKEQVKAKAWDKVIALSSAAIKEHQEAGADPEFYFYRLEGSRGLILAEEQKMYLKKKVPTNANPDTVKYFKLVNDLMVDAAKCDSLAQKPNKKGKVKNPYRKNLTGYVNSYMTKLFNGVKFSYNKRSYDKTLAYARTYLCDSGIKETAQKQRDENRISIASLAVLSAYTQKEYADAAEFLPLALRDESRFEDMLEIAAVTYANLADTVNLERALTEGCERFPDREFFFLKLLDLLNSQNRYEDALAIVEKQLDGVPKSRDLYFIRGKEESYLGRDDDALSSFLSAINMMADDYESYAAIGNIYLKRAHELYEKVRTTDDEDEGRLLSQQVADNYGLALRPFEVIRKNLPERTDMWLAELKEIYYKLNKGAELRSLEKIK